MPMTALQFILLALAVYRLALMVSKEDGPTWIFRKIRRSVPAKSSAKEGIQCTLCVSAWASIPISLFAYFHESLPLWARITGDCFILMLALSGAAIVVHMHTTKDL